MNLRVVMTSIKKVHVPTSPGMLSNFLEVNLQKSMKLVASSVELKSQS